MSYEPGEKFLRVIQLFARLSDTEAGVTTKQLAELFGVGAATVTRLKKTYRDTNAVAPKPHGGGHPPRIPREP